MIPLIPPKSSESRGFPRTRGGDPIIPVVIEKHAPFSPHTRGVIPEGLATTYDVLSFPRMRGGDPGGLSSTTQPSGFSPHARG